MKDFKLLVLRKSENFERWERWFGSMIIYCCYKVGLQSVAWGPKVACEGLICGLRILFKIFWIMKIQNFVKIAIFNHKTMEKIVYIITFPWDKLQISLNKHRKIVNLINEVQKIHKFHWLRREESWILSIRHRKKDRKFCQLGTKKKKSQLLPIRHDKNHKFWWLSMNHQFC